MKYLAEKMKLVQAIAPATNAGALAGDYVSLKNAVMAFIIVEVQQGNAATIALTVEKATAVDGTGSTAITEAVPIWANEDTASSDTQVKQTAAVSFTTSAAVKNKQVIFKIDPATLGDYDCLCVKAGASNVANVVGATYLLESRYAQATPPSAIVD